MTRGIHIFGIVAAGLLAASCAMGPHRASKADSADILRGSAPESESSNQAAMAGRTAMAYGDAWTATRLFKAAADANPTPINRFNLATGYQNTGRLQDAATLYGGLLVDGQFIWVTPNRDINNPDTPLRKFNIAEESARRLAAIARTVGSPSAAAALAESNVGGSASTEVGGPKKGPVTDERARQLDVAAEVVRGP